MKLKTTIPVTIEQARIFEDAQGEKGIKKENIFSQDDCHWMVIMGEYTLNRKFSAMVKWYQIQVSEVNGVPRETPKLMFEEMFVLETNDVQQLWEALQGQILATDVLIDKMDEFVLAGFVYWVTQVRQIFQQPFEVLEANKQSE